MGHSLLEKKENVFSVCRGLALATVYYQALGNRHTQLSLIPTPSDSPAPCGGSPMPPSPQGETNLFFPSDAFGQANIGEWGVSFGVHSSLYYPMPPPVSVWITPILDSGQGLLTVLLVSYPPSNPGFMSMMVFQEYMPEGPRILLQFSYSLSLDTAPGSLVH